jgi:hypothetical protein
MAVRGTRKRGGERHVPVAVEEREVWVGGGTPTVLGFRGSDGAMCGDSTGRRQRPQTATILEDPPSDAEIPVGVVDPMGERRRVEIPVGVDG